MAKKQSKVKPTGKKSKQSSASLSPLRDGKTDNLAGLTAGSALASILPHAYDDRVGSPELKIKPQLIPYLNGRQLPPSGYMLVELNGDLFWANPASIGTHKIGPLHTLTQGQKDRAVAYVKILSEHLPSGIEGVIFDLERERTPERELRLWERMAQVYRLELSKRPNAQKIERVLLWAVVLYSLSSPNVEHVLSAIPLAKKLPNVKRAVYSMLEHSVAYVMQTKLRLDLRIIKHYAETVEPMINDNLSTISSALKQQIVELNDVEQMDFEALSSDPTVKIDELFIHTLRTSTFIAAYALFESTLMQLCKIFGQNPDYPSFDSNKKGDGLRESKDYLKSAGFKFPAAINEWRKLQFYKSIRNTILHADSILDNSTTAKAVRDFVEIEKIGSVAQDGRLGLNSKAVYDISAAIDTFGVALRRALERT